MNRLRTYWVERAKWWSSRSLDWWAAHVTAFYIGGAILIMGAKFDELISLKLNEVGDFAAGAFGPVAFLWLVLGYIQQGRELKLSSEALRMQAEELKGSVAQQREMVAAQKESLRNYERSLQPLLHLQVSRAYWDAEDFCVGLTVNNTGEYCESVVVQLFGLDRDVRRFELDPLIRGATQTANFRGLHEWENFEVVIEYRTRSGAFNTQSFSALHCHEEGYGDSYEVRKHNFSS